MLSDREDTKEMTFEEFKKYVLAKVCEAHYMDLVDTWQKRIIFKEFKENPDKDTYFATILFPEDIRKGGYCIHRHSFMYCEYKLNKEVMRWVTSDTERFYREEAQAICRFESKFSKVNHVLGVTSSEIEVIR